ncbi:MAG TPA: hypothetical protein VJR89_22185, partial [Polyangiales bacterium]|nr:hypothetical protein [Polyangiales bacterium]
MRQARDAASEDAGDPEDAGEVGEACGNGRVDAEERCDVAIPRGQAGACPEGCSGREGCLQRVLVGRECAARCETVRITHAQPDDGCCPSEADGTIDNDCAAQCGNGVVERGERCDPPDTCPRADACKPRASCEEAIYRGDAEQCTASCELRKLERCVSGDGCCPAGCNVEADRDCEPASDCDGGCEPPNTTTCSQQHTGGECEA